MTRGADRDGCEADLSTIAIDRTWDGGSAAAGERVLLALIWAADRLTVRVDAPFHDDPPPAAPPGRCDRLWEHEVVELFLVGRGDRYLEVEFGPHGHYLALGLHGVRRVVDAAISIEFRATVAAGRWAGVGAILRRDLPADLERWNAFAMHGVGPARRYLAAHPLPGPRPDFHRIGAFPRLDRS